MKTKNKELILHCVTMIDPATSWFEIKEIPQKRADVIANIVEQTWLTRYPWPTQIIMDRGTEFMAEFSDMIQNEYGIKKKLISTRNPQANSVIERVHQVIGNMLRTFEVQKHELDTDDPWGGILSAIMFAVRSTFHTTLSATPMQLVFGRDAMLNIGFQADWNYIKTRKQELTKKNNLKENRSRIHHEYKPGDKVIRQNGSYSKYERAPYDGPYEIRKVYPERGTAVIDLGSYTDEINIRQLHPYKE